MCIQYTNSLISIAHAVAYEKAHVLHRDISPGNILINRKGEGMLIDWDLALLYADAKKDLSNRKPQMLWRTVRVSPLLHSISPI